MKTRHANFQEHGAQQYSRRHARFLFLRELPPREGSMPVGRNTKRAIVLNLSTTFPTCAWAFGKMA